MRSEPFREALSELVAGLTRQATAIMCSESLWWRCHRRLIADHVNLIERVPVLHVMHDGRVQPHRPTDGVRVAAGGLIYDVAQQPELPLRPPEA